MTEVATIIFPIWAIWTLIGLGLLNTVLSVTLWRIRLRLEDQREKTIDMLMLIAFPPEAPNEP